MRSYIAFFTLTTECSFINLMVFPCNVDFFDKSLHGCFPNTVLSRMCSFRVVRVHLRLGVGDPPDPDERFLPQYNFLPRVRENDDAYYLYFSDEAMENLKWVAASYSNVLPVYTPGPELLMKGDWIRIPEGQFKGGDASVIIQLRGGRRK